ncbi:phosphoribosylaminoimidazolesuccinocarboxamide synthase [Tindallia californiensis]|uniref:phosphoribosylaminoimidazolesuccinocarboxamide synthase n=1 Tax=Tindallia californiensis TaxID=159292 RepID=A0A1H3MJR9_9FIRM|nr:phosphoribosylaminoimidazolesuccinocarboxamide synthase [Tindallia californiensis]SDY76345.1 phosphoribosylaminoimidazole-succinocarboxamide synthase [Tindallia californiensis]
MELMYIGKTKNVYKLPDGMFLLKFKDDMTGKDGVFDPGSNEIGLTVKGAGQSGLRLTAFFFEHLKAKGIPTHYVDADPEAATMTVKPAKPFGKGLEVICRYRAVGSFHRRYGDYIEEGAALDAFVEVTLKDDQRQDPPISEDALDMLGILSKDDFSTLKALTQEIASLVKALLATKDLDLYDIKFEFGKSDDRILLIDEISGGNMRVFREGKPVEPFELENIMLSL